MKFKKLNAALGLLSIVFALLHVLYSVYAYITFYYNPQLKNIFAYPFLVLVCLHAVCGMLIVFTQKDGGRADLYPKQNLKTILQRASAALLFPLLILHINTFSLMRSCAQNAQWFFFALLILGELLFFASVLTHVAISFSKGLITLGMLSSEKALRTIDRIVYVLCAVLFIAAVFAVVKGQLAMFLPK